MLHLKSHFVFTKRQRNGIFLLLTIILGLQGISLGVDFSSEEIPVNHKQFALFTKEMDSLRVLEADKRIPKIYPFNPNFITDYKGYTLGMTSDEINRLLFFREQDQWINSVTQFQQVTKVSDSLLNTISPFFKFPEWVTNPKPKTTYAYQNKKDFNTPKSFQQKIDLNTATATQLQKVYGIGEAYSNRIVKYREQQNGFIADVQLQEVYGLKPEVIDRITNEFTVKTPKIINRVNVNKATREELVKIPYIDYEVAHQILEQRTLRDGYHSIDELTKVKDFPVQKIEIIKLYLTIN